MDLHAALELGLLPGFLRTRTAFPVPCRWHWAFSRHFVLFLGVLLCPLTSLSP